MDIVLASWTVHVASEVNTTVSICQHVMPPQEVVSMHEKYLNMKSQMIWGLAIGIYCVPIAINLDNYPAVTLAKFLMLYSFLIIICGLWNVVTFFIRHFMRFWNGSIRQVGGQHWAVTRVWYKRHWRICLWKPTLDRWSVYHVSSSNGVPDSKVHGDNMGPIRGWQDPGGPHVGPMNFAIWVRLHQWPSQCCILSSVDQENLWLLLQSHPW